MATERLKQFGTQTLGASSGGLPIPASESKRDALTTQGAPADQPAGPGVCPTPMPRPRRPRRPLDLGGRQPALGKTVGPAPVGPNTPRRLLSVAKWSPGYWGWSPGY